jgi:hypothetical protein
LEHACGGNTEIEVIGQRFLDKAAQGGVLEDAAPIEVAEAARAFTAAKAKNGWGADFRPRVVRTDFAAGEQSGRGEEAKEAWGVHGDRFRENQ